MSAGNPHGRFRAIRPRSTGYPDHGPPGRWAGTIAEAGRWKGKNRCVFPPRPAWKSRPPRSSSSRNQNTVDRGWAAPARGFRDRHGPRRSTCCLTASHQPRPARKSGNVYRKGNRAIWRRSGSSTMWPKPAAGRPPSPPLMCLQSAPSSAQFVS